MATHYLFNQHSGIIFEINLIIILSVVMAFFLGWLTND